MAERSVSKIESALIPITALAFLRLGTAEPYLLAGEGPILKIFGGQGRKLIRTERVFSSQAIHGVVCDSMPQAADNGGK